MELNRSLIPAGPRGRVIAAQTGDNYQSEAGSQSRRREAPTAQDREPRGRWMDVSQANWTSAQDQNKDANEASGEPAAHRSTVDGGSPKKDRIHQVSSQHVEQD